MEGFQGPLKSLKHICEPKFRGSNERTLHGFVGKKMKPTNPNARTYVNGTHASTHGYAVTHNSLLHVPLLPVSSVDRVEWGVQSIKSVECGV